MCPGTATLDLQRTFRTVINLADILVRIVVHVGITVWVQARSVVVDILLGVSGIFSVVHTGLVVKGHVLCRTEILRELLGHVETRIGTGIDLKTVYLATLGGDQDGTLGTLGTIEYDGLCPL